MKYMVKTWKIEMIRHEKTTPLPLYPLVLIARVLHVVQLLLGPLLLLLAVPEPCLQHHHVLQLVISGQPYCTNKRPYKSYLKKL